jgi:hypothetical protein
MKNQITFFLLIMAFSSYSQSINDDKTVTLTVSAQGQTLSEAKQNALRDAIEQAFGTFISSNTEILNDDLVKDEIVSVSNGNIQDYEVISEVELPNGGYATTLKATVSVTKLTSFVESKGIEAELKGNLFAFNIKQQKLNEQNEKKAVNNIASVTLKLLENSFYGTISPEEPFLKTENVYTLPYLIEVHSTKNTNNAITYFNENISQLSMNEEDKKNYVKLNKPIYEVVLVYTSKPISGEFKYKKSWSNSYCPVIIPDFKPKEAYKFITLYLRNEASIEILEAFTLVALRSIFNFKIKSQLPLNVDEIKKIDCGNSGYTSPLTGGFVPLSSPTLDRKFRSHSIYAHAVELMRGGKNPFGYGEDLIIGYTEDDFLCMGSSFANENFPNINNNLAKYFCQRRKSGIKFPLLVMLTHKYIEDGLVYRLNGSTDLTLEEFSKISTLKIEY